MVNSNPVLLVIRDQASEFITRSLVIMTMSKAQTMLQELKITNFASLKSSIHLESVTTRYNLINRMLEENYTMNGTDSDIVQT